jgi:hypothetical protein
MGVNEVGLWKVKVEMMEMPARLGGIGGSALDQLSESNISQRML